MDNDELKELVRTQSEMQMNEHLAKWYGWASPLGLSLFFGITLVGISIAVVLIRYAMLMK